MTTTKAPEAMEASALAAETELALLRKVANAAAAFSWAEFSDPEIQYANSERRVGPWSALNCLRAALSALDMLEPCVVCGDPS